MERKEPGTASWCIAIANPLGCFLLVYLGFRGHLVRELRLFFLVFLVFLVFLAMTGSTYW